MTPRGSPFGNGTTMKKILLAGVALVLLGAVAIGGFYAGRQPVAAEAQAAAAPAITADENRTAIEKIVRDYLVANPEVMVEMQAALETRQQESQRAAQLEVIQSSQAELFNAAYDGTLGNPNGKTTLVEFYDYNCGFCKRAVADMEALIASDPELRVVMKQFPILGPESQKAHVVSMAFKTLMPQKWPEFHHALMTAAGRAGEESAMELALSLGAEEAALRQAMQDPAIGQAINATYELASKLAITGTPSYVVGTEVVFGALGKDVLAEKVAIARACETGTC